MRFGELVSSPSRFVSAFKSALTAKVPAEMWASWTSGVTDHKFWLAPPAQSRENTLLYNDHARTRSIVAKIAKAVGRQSWYLEDKDGTRIDDHPALEFMRSGNPKLRGRKAIALTQAYLELNGEAFWVVGREGNRPGGKPIMFAPIPPYWVNNIPDDEVNGHYLVTPLNQAPVNIPAYNVIRFNEADPERPYFRGSSFANAARRDIEADQGTSTFLASFFKNYARPDLIISGTVDKPISNTDRAKLEAYWLERHGGSQRAGRPMFSTRPLDVMEVGKGLRENEVSKLQDQLHLFAYQHWGVPPEIWGHLSNSNRATIDSADYLFAEHTLVPRLDDLHDVLEPWIDAEFGLSKRGMKLRYDSPVKEDRDFTLSVMSAFPDDFTRNERRNLAGMPETADGDFMAEADPTDRPQPDADQALMDRPGVNDKPAVSDKPATAGKDDEKPGKALTESVATTQKDVDTPKDDALKAVSMLHVTNFENASPFIWRTLTPDMVLAISEEHEDPQVRADLTNMLTEIYHKLVAMYGEELLAEIGSKSSFELNMQVAKWLDQRASWLLDTIDETTRKDLQQSILEGVAKSEKVEALVKRVDEIFAEAAKGRAGLIAQTEATALTGYASNQAAVQAGFQEKLWLSTRDQLVRDTHQALDGQRVAINDDFHSPSGAHGPHPGALGTAAEDINCRCAMRPILPGEKAITDNKSFLDWHDNEFYTVETVILTKMKRIFEKQAEAVKDKLRRVAIH